MLPFKRKKLLCQMGQFEENRIVPKEGSFIGYKAALVRDEDKFIPCIITLEIPEDAERINALFPTFTRFYHSNKCRCNKAKVLDIQGLHGNKHYNQAYSWFNNAFIYAIGRVVKCRKHFDNNCLNDCSSGIHFFMNRIAALEWADVIKMSLRGEGGE